MCSRCHYIVGMDPRPGPAGPTLYPSPPHSSIPHFHPRTNPAHISKFISIPAPSPQSSFPTPHQPRTYFQIHFHPRTIPAVLIFNPAPTLHIFFYSSSFPPRPCSLHF